MTLPLHLQASRATAILERREEESVSGLNDEADNDEITLYLDGIGDEMDEEWYNAAIDRILTDHRLQIAMEAMNEGEM